MENEIVCFTGCTNIPKEKQGEILSRLKTVIFGLAIGGCLNFRIAITTDIDMLKELTILDLKKEFTYIELKEILSYLLQVQLWTDKDKEIFERTIKSADEFIYFSDTDYNGYLQKNNWHLLDRNNICGCYVKKEVGGTFYVIDYPQKEN